MRDTSTSFESFLGSAELWVWVWDWSWLSVAWSGLVCLGTVLKARGALLVCLRQSQLRVPAESGGLSKEKRLSQCIELHSLQVLT